jgi:membrane-associated protease RseP (regulator of RpoE activity)
MMWTVAGWVGFVVILLLSVMLHEFGHFLTARRFGMKVTEFFVGFGSRLWSFRRGETEYGVKAIPAGGYVRIVGMTELEEVPEEDQKRAFYRQPAPQRAVVLVAGSVVHFIIALLLFAFIPMALGQEKGASLTVSNVSDCVPAELPARADATCTTASPAKAAGLREGDKIVSADGRQVREWSEFTAILRSSGAETVPIVVERDGQQLTLNPTLTLQKRPTEADRTKTEMVPVLGVSPAPIVERIGPVAAVEWSGEAFWTILTGTFKSLGAVPGAIPDLVRQTFGDEPRSADGLVGVVGIGRVSGEVLGDDEPAALKIGGFLFMMAGLNVFIGVFNLLPLLPLDGGHLAVLGYEKARQGVYRLFGRADPGRVDLTKLLPVAYVFLIFIIGLSVLLLAADIVNPITLNG